jgi:hypothetical protein
LRVRVLHPAPFIIPVLSKLSIRLDSFERAGSIPDRWLRAGAKGGRFDS